MAPMDGWLVVPLMLSAQGRWGRGPGGTAIQHTGCESLGCVRACAQPMYTAAAQRSNACTALRQPCLEAPSSTHRWRSQ